MAPSPNNLSQLSLSGYLLRGGLGFGAVSLLVFATVAFGELWLYATFRPAGAYVFWTLLFIGLSARVFNSLIVNALRGPRFYALFSLAFLIYALAWCLAYFWLRDARGEWLGSLLGTFAMSAVFALGFRKPPLLPRIATLLFVSHSVGYFIGSNLYSTLGGPAGMLLWGVNYGLFFGAGIGALLYLAQK
jgi:hypothetical protein